MKPWIGTNPWITIWLYPRQTMRNIYKGNWSSWIPLLIIAWGLDEILVGASWRSAGEKLSLGSIVWLAMIWAPLSGLMFVIVDGWSVKVAGRWLGGKGDLKRVCTAVAWSSVPSVASLLLWAVGIAIFKDELFQEVVISIFLSTWMKLLWYTYFGLTILLAAWGFVLYLKCVAESHDFSVWRSLSSLFLAIPLKIIGLVDITLLFAPTILLPVGVWTLIVSLWPS